MSPGFYWLALDSSNDLVVFPHKHYILLDCHPLIWDLPWFVNLRNHCSFYLFKNGMLYSVVKLCFETSEGRRRQSPWEGQCGYDWESSYKLQVIFNRSRQIGLDKSNNENAQVAVGELCVAMNQSGLFWEMKWKCYEGQTEKEKGMYLWSSWY